MGVTHSKQTLAECALVVPVTAARIREAFYVDMLPVDGPDAVWHVPKFFKLGCNRQNKF